MPPKRYTRGKKLGDTHIPTSVLAATPTWSHTITFFVAQNLPTSGTLNGLPMRKNSRPHSALFPHLTCPHIWPTILGTGWHYPSMAFFSFNSRWLSPIHSLHRISTANRTSLESLAPRPYPTLLGNCHDHLRLQIKTIIFPWCIIGLWSSDHNFSLYHLIILINAFVI